MSKGLQSRSSEVLFDGATTIILNSGRLTNAAAAQFGQVVVAPCDLYIHSIHYHIDTQFTHASSKFNVGKLSDDDAYVDGIVLQNIATGSYEVDMAAATTISRGPIPKGTPISAGLDAADTTGKISITVVLTPYHPGNAD